MASDLCNSPWLSSDRNGLNGNTEEAVPSNNVEVTSSEQQGGHDIRLIGCCAHAENNMKATRNQAPSKNTAFDES